MYPFESLRRHLKLLRHNHKELGLTCICYDGIFRKVQCQRPHSFAYTVELVIKDRCWWTVGAMHNERLCISKNSIFSAKTLYSTYYQ